MRLQLLSIVHNSELNPCGLLLGLIWLPIALYKLGSDFSFQARLAIAMIDA